MWKQLCFALQFILSICLQVASLKLAVLPSYASHTRCSSMHYTQQIGHICETTKLVNVHIWGRLPNISAW